MSTMSHVSIEAMPVCSFEQLCKGLGSLSLHDREEIDRTAKEVFLDADSLAAEYGPASAEAARADELVLLYSCLESHSSLNNRRLHVPQQRKAS
ncbi:MAG: hypothetical protein QFB87_01530 [Patescibacteria group bacterium]|nr:hypothetical protein [Patescibacteria group bacterium]